MADVLTHRTGAAWNTTLYDQLYIPLSEMFAHPSGVALLRHVGRDARLTDILPRITVFSSDLITEIPHPGRA